MVARIRSQERSVVKRLWWRLHGWRKVWSGEARIGTPKLADSKADDWDWSATLWETLPYDGRAAVNEWGGAANIKLLATAHSWGVGFQVWGHPKHKAVSAT